MDQEGAVGQQSLDEVDGQFVAVPTDRVIAVKIPAVSYTHLSKEFRLVVCVCYQRFLIRQFKFELFSHELGDVRFDGPVSYTHLDVYKRQASFLSGSPYGIFGLFLSYTIGCCLS